MLGPNRAARNPASNGRRSLRETEDDHARSERSSCDAFELLACHTIEVRDVILDLVLPILTRHPGRAHWAIRGRRRIGCYEIEPVERLWCDDAPHTVVDRLEDPNELRSELAIAMNDEPQLARRPGLGSECVVSGRSPGFDAVLPHPRHVTRLHHFSWRLLLATTIAVS